MSNNLTGRVFGASLKPAWSKEQINEFLNKTKGDIVVYLINHDKDFNEQGEIVEEHTHIYLEYTNPRKITTVANLLGVETNFIEIVRNKKGYLRYLTHMDETDKHKYDNKEVYGNGTIPYETLVLGNSLTDKEIAEYIIQGRGIELLGVVSASKLRTIQSFLHFDTTNTMLNEIRHLNGKMDIILDTIDKVETIALSFVDGFKHTLTDMTDGMRQIANEIAKTRVIASTRKR